jgi:signal transduction histidine kinase
VDSQAAAARVRIGMNLESDLGIPEPDFLERAAASVIENRPAVPLLSPDQDMLRQALAEVIEGVRDALAGSEPTPPKHTQVDRCLLLRSLRGVVLEDWSDEDGSLLETVRAFEATERALGAADEDVAASPFSRSLLREVVHLLLSPLGSVVMLAGMMLEERQGPLNEQQQRQLRIIHRAATSAATASSDILTLTSPEKYYGASRRFSVTDTVAIVADVVRPVTEARGSELTTRAQVERTRRGPASGLAQALLGLATRVALMTRDGTVELDVDGTERRRGVVHR